MPAIVTDANPRCLINADAASNTASWTARRWVLTL
jgi:hypothetical protein